METMTKEVYLYAKKSVDVAAAKLSRRGGIRGAELADIKAEIMLDVLQRLPKHDHTKYSYKTFVTRIVKNKVMHILRERMTQKVQAQMRMLSLEEPVEPMDSIPSDDAPEKLIDSCYSSCGIDELCLDLKDVISKLSEIQQRFCFAVMSGENISDIAKDEELPIPTFYKRVVHPIRRIFASAGLDNYFN